MEKLQSALRRMKGSADQIYRLDRPILLIGRAPQCEIVIDGISVPDVAAQIELRDGSYVVSSINASPLLVNGKKKKTAELSAGDRLTVAGEEFVLEAIAPAHASTGLTVTTSDPALVLESMHRFIASIGQERDLTVLLRKIIDNLFDLIGGTDAFIFTLNAKGQPEICVSSSDKAGKERFSDTVIQEVLGRDEGIAIPNALSSPQFNASQSIIDLRLVSVMCCPVKVAGRTVGVLYLGTRKPAESFAEADLRILTLYATVAGMLINHVDYICHQNKAIRQLTHYQDREGVIGESKKIQDVLQRIEAVAHADITVLLEGETGTGKDVFAHYIHNKSSRRGKKIVVVNCSSLQGELLESELFGHKRGSFTGAQTDHEGLFAAADGGTLFLDEIGEMSEGLQAKLLRTIETGKIRPVGATSEKKVNVRIICATNRDLAAMVSQGTFRKDLYYRINQFSLRLPPLREREGDAVLLAYYFLEKYKSEYPAKNIMDFHPDSLRFISIYEWPGNVRELAAVIHCAVLSASGPFVTVDIGEKITTDFNFEAATRNFQKRLLEAALLAASNNREQAAKLLGMTRSTFFRYLALLRE